ncbi:type II secretion system F family protein [archaeon]|jgi:pilus assembly protein TadC|nr:type II secretion system F family protein [archaeon]MBT4351038.1 type II secretion system F family protein [archaeon]MBT4648548.1 type II secretion system F family protein [archaeon]MBT6821367.1 type II secretion system F family protein [archaeon]MBT7391950.1 type II secretion system F family protein [archaeon]
MVTLSFIDKSNPKIAKALRTASIQEEPEIFINKNIKNALILSIIITILATIVVIEGDLRRDWSPVAYVAIPIVLISFFLIFVKVFMNAPNLIIKKRKRELESDLLYSARFLLLKMESGSPILNALIDVSNLHTKSSKYFKDIVADIYLGTPLEEAIDWSKKYSPSKSFAKVLEEIRNSLKTGSDIERSLKSTLDEMTKDHVIAIKEYGKKLSPVSMFYMIIGTILPSLGSAMIVVGLGFVNLNITFTVFLFFLFILAVVQIFFIMFFKALKPAVMN